MLFVASWRYRYSTQGVALPYVHWYLALTLVMPTYVLYPFCASIVNIVTVGTDIYGIQDTIETAFWVTTLGFWALGLAYVAQIRSRGQRARSVRGGFALRLERALFDQRVNRALIILITVLSVLLLAITLPKAGFSFDLRAAFLADPALRAPFNLWYTLYIFIATIVILAAIDRKRVPMVLLQLSPAVFLAFISGSRTIALTPFVLALVVYSEVRHSIRLKRVGVIALVLLAAVIGLYEVRQSDDAALVDIDGVSPALFSLVYGNTFSDLRDFALVLSVWNGDLLWGKSILAGILGFIPRDLLSFREAFSIGVFTNNLLGYDSSVHPGVRMGLFGEFYLNFGLVGVTLCGGFAGWLFAKIDQSLDDLRRARSPATLMRGYVTILPAILAANIFISAAFWSVYIFIALITFVLLLASVAVGKRPGALSRARGIEKLP